MATIKSWDEIDEQMDREAAAISRRMTSINHRKKRGRDKDMLLAGEGRVLSASGAGEGRKSLGQVLQGCR